MTLVALPLGVSAFARRVLIVEDEGLFAGLLAQTLESANFVVEVASNVAAARKKINSFDPDMLLLDISLGDGPSGVHLAHAVHVTNPEIAMLFLTRHRNAVEANNDGLDLPPNVGFLRKQEVHDRMYLLEAIEKVFAEKPNEVRQDEPRLQIFEDFSHEEIRTLKLLASGKSNGQIAVLFNVSIKSVERIIEKIYHKLEIDTKAETNARVEAARRYFQIVGIPEGDNS